MKPKSDHIKELIFLVLALSGLSAFGVEAITPAPIHACTASADDLGQIFQQPPPAAGPTDRFKVDFKDTIRDLFRYVFYQTIHKKRRFAITGRPPELWDAVTGERRDLIDCQSSASGMVLPLKFAPAQSFFIV